MPHTSTVRDRQRPLVRLYKQEPSAAWVVDKARTDYQPSDPLHTRVVMGPEDQGRLDVALHTAVGGESDLPVPGDILAAALATCLDSTIRCVTDRLGAQLEHLCVSVRAEVDVRGTLMVDPHVPVGFQGLHVDLDLRLAEGAPEGAVDKILMLAENCCVVLQTLRSGVPVSLRKLTQAA